MTAAPGTNSAAGSAQADNITMKSGGYYSLATIGAKDVIDGAWPLFEGALEAMDLATGAGPFTMSDMGCADGGTSIDTVGRVLGFVRERAPTRPLQMVYSDQIRNDYNTLFRIVAGQGPIESYHGKIPGLHVLASATSFYDQILPAGTLDLGFSATAMHWLSAKPCDISGHLHSTGAEGEELAAFEAQGKRDWERILLQRAAELRPGGHLVLLNFGRDEEGRYLGNTGGRHMFDIMNGLWRDSLAKGVIDEAEYRAMTLPQYYNTVAEFTAPLTDPASPVHRAGLRLTHAETRVVRCPYAVAFEDHGDAAKFARDYIPTIRSWNESIYKGALSPERAPAERDAIIEDYYGRYEALVRAEPAGHGMDYVHCYLVIRKEG